MRYDELHPTEIAALIKVKAKRLRENARGWVYMDFNLARAVIEDLDELVDAAEAAAVAFREAQQKRDQGWIKPDAPDHFREPFGIPGN